MFLVVSNNSLSNNRSIDNNIRIERLLTKGKKLHQKYHSMEGYQITFGRFFYSAYNFSFKQLLMAATSKLIKKLSG